jgi:hypothetical protein
VDLPHPHTALADAQEQAVLVRRIVEESARRGETG